MLTTVNVLGGLVIVGIIYLAVLLVFGDDDDEFNSGNAAFV